jgi:hypothetical protein
MLQTVVTARKQPMAREYCTFKRPIGNEAPYLELILNAADGRHSPESDLIGLMRDDTSSHPI